MPKDTQEYREVEAEYWRATIGRLPRERLDVPERAARHVEAFMAKHLG